MLGKYEIEELARQHNMNPATLTSRLMRGVSLEDALTRPVRKKAPPRKYKVIYPNLLKWIDNNGMTALDFSAYIDIQMSSLLHIIYGFSVPRKDTIDKILEATGMTYEEAFKTE